MFYISEEELRFKKNTIPAYFDEKLSRIFMDEMFKLKEQFPVDNFTLMVRNAAQFYLNRTYLDDMLVFFEDGSILKFEFSDKGFKCDGYHDEEISTAFYYGRYSIRL